jgi:ABC-type Fe3+-hydroxamate transport system substrate-binding protein
VTDFPAHRVTGANSNTFIKAILEECGIDTPEPQVNAPGWTVNLQTYLSRRMKWLRGRGPR